MGLTNGVPERMQEAWNTPIYAFFRPEVRIDRSKGAAAYEFRCAAPKCGSPVRRALETQDKTSTSNLRRHVKSCKHWGEGVLDEAGKYKTAAEARPVVQAYLRTGSLTVFFKRLGKGKLSFSTRQHTSKESR